jgi:hypothetical protein
MNQVSTRLISFLKGGMGWTITFFVGGFLILWLSVGISDWINNTADIANYVGDFHSRVNRLLFLLCAMGLGVTWWAIAMLRCTARFQSQQRSYLLVFASMVFGLSVLSILGKTSYETMKDWHQVQQINSANPLLPIQVTVDSIKGKIILRGDIGFGSYTALEQAIKVNPDLKWIDIESSGGHVIEALALAKLIEKSQLNTYSLNECLGACTLVFAAGMQRHLGVEARLGFQRGGSLKIKAGKAWKTMDAKSADYYRARGTAEFFIKAAMDMPADKVWIVATWQALQARYATRLMYPNGVLVLN